MGPSTNAMAIALNNRGASLFLKGDLNAATTCFRAALNTHIKTLSKDVDGVLKQRQEKASIARSTSPRSFNTERGGSGLSELPGLVANTQPSGEPQGVQHHNTTLTSHEEQQASPLPSREHGSLVPYHPRAPSDQRDMADLPSIFIAMKAVTLRAQGKDNPRASAKTISAMTFNLALCYHMLSSSCAIGETNNHRQNAVRLYTTANVLRLKALARTQQPGQHQQPSMLDLSILNNTGVILVQTGDHSRARRNFEELALALNRLPDASKAKHDAAQFVKNLSLILPESILAPAA